jgi:hypothetical protein
MRARGAYKEHLSYAVMLLTFRCLARLDVGNHFCFMNVSRHLWTGLRIKHLDRVPNASLALALHVLTLSPLTCTCSCIDTEGIRTLAGRTQWISSPAFRRMSWLRTCSSCSFRFHLFSSQKWPNGAGSATLQAMCPQGWSPGREARLEAHPFVLIPGVLGLILRGRKGKEGWGGTILNRKLPLLNTFEG